MGDNRLKESDRDTNQRSETQYGLAKNGENWYNEAIAEFQRRTNLLEGTLEYFQRCGKELGIDKARSCLSIGAGQGLLDCPLMEKYFPALENYTALEPDVTAATELQLNINEALEGRDVQVDIVSQTAESWQNVDNRKFDVILLLHVLYHIPDRAGLLNRCRQLMTPGGVVIIGICCGDNNTNTICTSKFTKTVLYSREDLLHDLSGAVIKHHKSDILRLDYDLSDRNATTLNAIVTRNNTPEQLAELDEYVEELAPDGQGVHEVFMVAYQDQGHQKILSE